MIESKQKNKKQETISFGEAARNFIKLQLHFFDNSPYKSDYVQLVAHDYYENCKDCTEKVIPHTKHLTAYRKTIYDATKTILRIHPDMSEDEKDIVTALMEKNNPSRPINEPSFKQTLHDIVSMDFQSIFYAQLLKTHQQTNHQITLKVNRNLHPENSNTPKI